MSDAEFELISPLLPAPKKLGRKPTDFRVVLNAVFYMIRVGCPWRLLPKDFFRYYGANATSLTIQSLAARAAK
jgi:transposase